MTLAHALLRPHTSRQRTHSEFEKAHVDGQGLANPVRSHILHKLLRVHIAVHIVLEAFALLSLHHRNCYCYEELCGGWPLRVCAEHVTGEHVYSTFILQAFQRYSRQFVSVLV